MLSAPLDARDAKQVEMHATVTDRQDLAVQEVTQANVYRLFATLFNSAMRWTE